MRLFLAALLGVCAAWLAIGTLGAQETVFYRCTDASGAVTMQNDKPCGPGMKQEIRRVGALPTAAPPTRTEAPPKFVPPPTGAFELVVGPQQALPASGIPAAERYRPPLGPGIAERFEFARVVTDQEVGEAQEVRTRFRERFRQTVGEGVLLLPTMPDIAPLLTETEEALNTYRNTAINLLCLSGLSGLPQVSMPVASRMGAPLGLSVVGPAGSDASLVRLAARLG